jgi:hypothetical protein
MDDQRTDREGGGSVGPDTGQYLQDVRAIVRELNEWADTRMTYGHPATDEEKEVIQKLKEGLAGIKKNLADMKERIKNPTR